MALTNMDKRRPNLVTKRERTVERERREEEKREEEKKKRRRREEEEKRSRKAKLRYGTMTFSIDLWNFKALYG